MKKWTYELKLAKATYKVLVMRDGIEQGELDTREIDMIEYEICQFIGCMNTDFRNLLCEKIAQWNGVTY